MYLLPHQLINSVTKYADKTALIINKNAFTYAEVYADCLQLVGYIQSTSYTRGGRVVILSGNSYLTIIAFWAALLCDLVPCIIDPECNADTLKNILKNIAPDICVYHHLSVMQEKVITDSKVLHITHLPKKITRDNNFFYQSKNTESHLAMIMHTSGSTGEPKGVMLSHRNVTAAIESITQYLTLETNDVLLSVLPLHFDYGLYQMLLSFSIGATLILENSMLFPQLVAQKIAEYNVTVLPCVPVMVQLFYLASEHIHFDCRSVRIVTNTGEKLTKGHIEKIKSLFPYARIFSMYGLTECKRCSFVPPEMLDQKSDSIGIAMPNVEMWVQDSSGNRVAPNVEGELVIFGPTVMMGYWHNLKATQEKMVIDSTGKKILKSGDTVTMDTDGFFYFKGRGDSMLKYKGIKLHSVTIKNKLILLDNVNRAHLFVDSKSAVDQQLMVCLEVDKNQYHHDALIKAVNAEFPSIQKPDHIYITDRFPSLSNGKLDTQTLEKVASEYFMSEMI